MRKSTYLLDSSALNPVVMNALRLKPEIPTTNCLANVTSAHTTSFSFVF